MGTSLKKVAKKAKEYKYVLLVMRHAKTEPFSGNGSDAGRELTDKGRKQAKAVAKGLDAFKMVPDRIACSSATRARQTCDRLLKVFGDDPKVDYRQSLYEGGVQSVFDELAQTKDKHHTLLILGHEPTVSIACQWLASAESDPTLLDLLNLGMSPASIAMFGSNEPFNQWQLHSGELIALLTAKDFE
ncbi:histidine phosphatase family protein [uncultured Bifidobacterium sp.]|uniref:SixA phosphatase family protein n=1 Tax=uncultured Bifidobacterium sp. TaxID=165187 RepID=UPI00259A7C17|nr:histidine phosphatase family protein [uncultured Bifidobacterium sp.]